MVGYRIPPDENLKIKNLTTYAVHACKKSLVVVLIVPGQQLAFVFLGAVVASIDDGRLDGGVPVEPEM